MRGYGHHWDMREILANGGIPIATGPMNNDLVYPGHGYPENPREDRPGLSPFGRMAKGQGLGKSSLLFYDGNSDNTQPSQVSMLTIEGDNLDACQLTVTLAPPRVIALPFVDLVDLDLQVLTGEQDNAEAPSGNFPGTASPLSWPPLEAKVEWGVHGAASQAIVDYINGVTFSVVASYLRVTALTTQTLDNNGVDGTSAAYYLASFVGPGWARGNAQRTIYVGDVTDQSESARYPIPAFARRAWMFGNDQSSNPPLLTAGTLRLWQSPQGATCVANYFQNGNQPVSFEIPNAAQYFSVVNGSGAVIRPGVVFELALT